MFGVRLDTYTLFHTTEDLAGLPYLYERRIYELRIADREGNPRSVSMRRQDMSVKRCFIEKDAWLEKQGLLRRGQLGFGTLLYLPDARAVHKAVFAELERDPLFLVAEESRVQAGSSNGSHSPIVPTTSADLR